MTDIPPSRAADDELYWASVRAQYAPSPDFINLENGYYGMPAASVLQAFQRYQVEVNAQNAYFLRKRWSAELSQVMDALAHFSGVGRDELLITRNAMEAMNILMAGYPFQPGDEVLLAAHEYPSVLEALDMFSARRQFALRRVALPLDPDSDEQIVGLYENAIGPNTRVLLLTHMVNRTGQIMPVAKIAAMARRHAVDVWVDAAQSFAQFDFTLSDLDADFVAVNLHKWLGAPLGVGMLYVRRDRIADIAPLYGDTGHAQDDIGKLGHVGTVPPEPIMAIIDAIAFHLRIGARNKEARLRYLTQYWIGRVRALPGVRIFTPRDPRRSCAIGAFGIDGIPAAQVAEHLFAEHRILTVERPIGDEHCVRVTPHLYTSMQELDLLIGAIKTLAHTT